MRCKTQFSTPPHLRKLVGLQESPHKKENKGNTSVFIKDEAQMDRHSRRREGRTEVRRTDPTIRPIRRICRGTSGGFAGVHQGYIRVHSEDLQGYIRVHSGTFGYIRTRMAMSLPQKTQRFCYVLGYIRCNRPSLLYS